MNDATLTATGLSKRFGALAVLNNVDFVVGPGEAIGIVGPDGAGKTTLLNLPSGAYAPSQWKFFCRSRRHGARRGGALPAWHRTLARGAETVRGNDGV